MFGLIASSLLFTAALKSTAVLSAAFLLVFLMRRRSAAARHLVWTGMFAALLALPLLSLSLPALRAPVSQGLLANSLLFRADATAQQTSPQVAAARQRAAAPGAAGPNDNAPWQPSWPMVLVTLWAVGAVVSLAQMIIAIAAVSRLRRRAHPVNLPDLARLSQALGIVHDVDLLETGCNTMPMAFGLLHPAVLLPADAAGWGEDRRKAVLLHELAHVRRGDVATHFLARTALCLCWWNPLAWAAWREFQKEREQAADDMVLSVGAKPSEYASHLLEIARAMQTPRPIGWAAVAMARPSQLEQRLVAILDSGRNRHSARRLSALASILTAAAMVAPLAALQAQEDKSGAPSKLSLPDVDATIRAATSARDFATLDQAASEAVTLRKFDIARKFLESSLTLREQQSGPLSKDYGVGLSHLGDLARREGSKEAVEWYMKAETVLRNDPEAASALTYLGISAIGHKEYDQAIVFLEEARGLAGAANRAGPSPSPVLWMAIARDRQGNMEEADKLYRDATWQARTYPDQFSLTTAQQMYADFLTRQGREPDAAALKSQMDAEQKIAQNQKTMALPQGTYKIGSGVTAPKVLSKVEPQYSEEARIAKWHGTVVLNVIIGADGLANTITVVRGLGFGLDEQAMDAVSKWRFEPATKAGQPVAVAAHIEVNFRLL